MGFDRRNKATGATTGAPTSATTSATTSAAVSTTSANDPAAGAAGAPVRSVEAALRVLELLACSLGPLRVTDIAGRLDLGKPRVCRHLATLEAMGLARRVGRQGYTFGERLRVMAHHVQRERTLGDVAQPLLEALRDDVRHTVVLSAPGADGAVVLGCAAGPQPAGIDVRAGTLLRYPHSPAARLAVALGAAPARGKGKSRSDGELASQAPAREALAHWRALGVDYERDTQGTGLGGVAAPVFAGTLLVALVSVVVPSRLLLSRPPAPLVAALRRNVAAIERGLAA